MNRLVPVIVLSVVAGGLAACQRPPLQEPRPARIALTPDAAGLSVLPHQQRIDFGRAPAGVISVLDRELGPHEALPLAGCPAAITARHRWADLELTFTTERFVGWRQNGVGAGQTCAS